MSGDLVPITDYDVRVIERLLSQYRGKPRIESLMLGGSEPIQVLEDLLNELLVDTQFAVAVGVHLDAWGALVGEERGGLTDAEYRVFIAARILANKSLGTGDELIRIFDLIDGAGVVRENRLLWLGFELYSYRPFGDLLSDALKRRIARMMEEIRPDGVNMSLVEVPFGYFGFAEDPNALGYDVGVYSWRI